jgi:molybdopterin molybdotransferase
MISVKEAQEKVLNSKVQEKIKKVLILDSLSLVLAEDIISNDDIPAYDNSAMDGFAVRSVDIIGADKNYPVKLKLLGEDIPAGSVPSAKLELGYCIPIMTGAPIPQGCDCVVMKEDVLKEGSEILIYKECKAGVNIRYKGEDIKKGDKILVKGKKIFPGDIGVMASIGRSEVCVKYPPTVGVLPTGNELVEIGEELKEGKVRDSNSYSLTAQVKEAGAIFLRFGIVRDEKSSLKGKILEAISNCDILLITGGVSVGDYDYVKEVLNEIGTEFIFWCVNQRPGKPLAFLTYKDKFIFGMPGNPVSVMVCFEIYVRPLIKKIMGDEKIFRNIVHAIAASDYEHKEGRTEFTRVKLEKIDNQFYFKLTGIQGSGILTSMSDADGLAVFQDNMGDIKKGGLAEVFLLKN